MRLLLLMSSPEELRPWLRRVRHRGTIFQEKKAWHFEGQGYVGLALLTGMGGSAPCVLAEQAMASWSPDLVLVAGFGGAITSLPRPGGILIASECWRLGPDDRLSRVDFQPAAPAAALKSLVEAGGLPVAVGALLTTPEIMAKVNLPPQAFRLPQAVLDLETAGIAAAAQAHQLPFLAVRAVTDGAGEEIQDFLADLINRYQGVPLSRLVSALGADPRRVGYCLHLWRRSRQAGANLARALELILDRLSRVVL
jgi:adenosylhomocysteine nucleosidase